MPRYQYLLRSPKFDEIRYVEHDGHGVGDVVVIDGQDWIVESVGPIHAGRDLERVVLRRVESQPRLPNRS